MRKPTFVNLTVALALIALIVIPNLAIAFKAPDNDSVTAEKIGLESISIRMNQPITGDESNFTISSVNKLLEPSKSKAKLKKILEDRLGFKHIRLTQEYQGIPAVGAEMIVHIKNNSIYLINGKMVPSINVSVEPSIQANDALQIGLDEQRGKPDLRVSKQPALVIYGSHLAYHYIISHGGASVGQWFYYVDAHTGDLITRFNNIKYAPPTGDGFHTSVHGDRLTGEDGTHVEMTGWKENTGNYYLYNYNDLWGVYDEDAFDWEQNASAHWGALDPAAISCGLNFALTQDWVTLVLGRNSFDNAGAFARCNVHTGTNYVNAYWDGSDFHFGDGDGITANALSTLDIVAHEYGHAVTQYTSDLVYSYEPGALNESYSDIMGAVVEFYQQLDGTASYPNADPGLSDWLLGEDAWVSDVALRDLKDPQRYQQPSYYKGTYWHYGPGDNGGVHTNSGVQNFAYYLLAEGGTGTNDGQPYDITGIGITAAAEVAMRANIFYLTTNSQYIDSRDAWINAATDLGYDVPTVEAVWTAVGVGAPSASINLISPADGSVLPQMPPPIFEWQATGFDGFKIQFSGLSDFPTGNVLSFPPLPSAWYPSTSIRLPVFFWNGIVNMYNVNGIVYWRVVGRNTDGITISEPFSFTIQ